jgi:hypothetical protein
MGQGFHMHTASESKPLLMIEILLITTGVYICALVLDLAKPLILKFWTKLGF